ncbi:MAG: glycosyltransferase family 4 protein [Gammaproteobacteria bacterium]
MPSHWASNFGGSEYQVRCLLDLLVSSSKFDIYYLARHVNPQYASAGYNIIQINKGGGLWRHGLFLDLPQLHKAIHKLQPDVIYQRVGCAYTGATAYYSKYNNCNMIWHASHDEELLNVPNLSQNLLSRQFDKTLLRYGIRHANYIITQTHKQATLLRQQFNREPDLIVPNFHPRPVELVDVKKRHDVVWVANLKKWKRPELFVKLADALRTFQSVNFIMIGRGGHSEWHRRIIAQAHQTQNLNYIGECTQEEVNRYLSTAKIFVNTSSSEGFPNTFIQAWMRKVPVVSLNVNPDAVFDQEQVGFVSGTFEQMVSDVKKLIQDDMLRQSMGNNACRYAMRVHSEENALQIVQFIDACA